MDVSSDILLNILNNTTTLEQTKEYILDLLQILSTYLKHAPSANKKTIVKLSKDTIVFASHTDIKVRSNNMYTECMRSTIDIIETIVRNTHDRNNTYHLKIIAIHIYLLLYRNTQFKNMTVRNVIPIYQCMLLGNNTLSPHIIIDRVKHICKNISDTCSIKDSLHRVDVATKLTLASDASADMMLISLYELCLLIERTNSKNAQVKGFKIRYMDFLHKYNL